MAEYICREAIIDDLEKEIEAGNVALDEDVWINKGLRIAIRDIKDIKTADVQPVKWISTEDRLPNENQKCLVYRNTNADLKITTGIWHSERKAFDGLRHGTRLEDAIAWQPLPEPPKDGDTNDSNDK